MAERDQTNRWRCTTVGCNPKLIGEEAAEEHRNAEGHRIAKWPIRSAEGKRKAAERCKTGYYDRYNVGAKSAMARGIGNGGGIMPHSGLRSSTSKALGAGHLGSVGGKANAAKVLPITTGQGRYRKELPLDSLCGLEDQDSARG